MRASREVADIGTEIRCQSATVNSAAAMVSRVWVPEYAVVCADQAWCAASWEPWVAGTRLWRTEQVRCSRSWGPTCSVLYRFVVSLARLAVRSGRSKGLEIIVLRHQLTVLYRQNNRPEHATAYSGTHTPRPTINSQLRLGFSLTPRTAAHSPQISEEPGKSTN